MGSIIGTFERFQSVFPEGFPKCYQNAKYVFVKVTPMRPRGVQSVPPAWNHLVPRGAIVIEDCRVHGVMLLV